MKIPRNKKLITDKSGKQRIITVTDPRLDASAKIRQRTSKKQTPVAPGKAGLR